MKKKYIHSLRRKKISNKNTEAKLTTCKRLGYSHDKGLSITDINKLHDQSLTYVIILTPISIKESIMTISN